MTRKRIPCTLSSRVIGPSSHSGSLGRVVTLGKIGPMAFFFVHEKCQHYYESGQSSDPVTGPAAVTRRSFGKSIGEGLLRRLDHSQGLIACDDPVAFGGLPGHLLMAQRVSRPCH